MGNLYIGNDLLAGILRQTKSTNPPKLAKRMLTNREGTIAKLMAQGKTNKQICTLLNVRPSTVSTFKKKVFTKLEVTNLMELGRMEITSATKIGTASVWQ